MWRRARTWSLSLVAAAHIFSCGHGSAESEVPSTLEILVNGTEDPGDDLVAFTAPTSAGVRPSTVVVIRHRGSTPSIRVAVHVEGAGSGTIDPAEQSIAAGESASFRLYGDRASLAEGDTTIVAAAVAGSAPKAMRAITVVSGIAIDFRGTFRFATENNNGYRASMIGKPFAACDGVADPFVWRATALDCENVLGAIDQLYFGERDTLVDRFSIDSGKRARIAVEVTGVRSFGPSLDLGMRDPKLRVGTVVDALEAGSVARIFGQDCDGNPATGNPQGQEDGAEVVLDFGLRFGDAMGLKYRDASPTTVARLWTKFTTPPTSAERSADKSDVENVLLPANATGCTSPAMTYFDSTGVFRCKSDQSLRELLLRNVGFRSMVRRTWANWTSRKLVVADLSTPGNSFVAALFAALSTGRPPEVPAGAEAFMQFSKYDWFTLMGVVTKGTVATSGGIPARFKEWTMNSGCPAPVQPDVSFDDDPTRP